MLGRVEGFLRESWPRLGLGSLHQSRRLRMAVVSGGLGVHNKLVCPCWEGDDLLPSLVVKFPRYPQYNYRVLAEHGALESARGFLSPGPGADRVPRPLVSTEIDGLCVTVESAWRGRSLLAHLRENAGGIGGYLDKLSLPADWLATLHARSAMPATSQQMQEFVFAPLESAGEDFNLSAQEKDALEYLRSRACKMADSAPLPVVFNHNDLNIVNVLVDEHGELTQVIDWDVAGPGLPATDLIYFLMRLASEAEAAGSDEALDSYKELFFGASAKAEQRPANEFAGYTGAKSPYGDSPGEASPRRRTSLVCSPRLQSQGAARWLRDYCRQVGLAWDWLPVLFPLAWIQHARNEKYLLALHARGQMLYGISSHVAFGPGKGAEGEDASERGLFRERLRYYLNNLDGFALSSREIQEGVR